MGNEKRLGQLIQKSTIGAIDSVAAGISATDLIDHAALVLGRSGCPLFIVSQIRPH
jgi:hypothetical protein